MEDRDSNGRFIKGHAKTGGRKTRLEEDVINNIWKKKFTPKKIEMLLDKLYTLDMKGDMSAIKLTLEYLCGRPVERKEITGADNQPLVIRVVYDEDREDNA